MRKLLIAALAIIVLAGCSAPVYHDPNTARPTKGNPNAAVVVEEFADFQCPACGAAHPLIKRLQEKYGDTVLWKYYHFPLTSIHPYAFNAAMAAECANDQGKFWEYYDTLYVNQKNLTRSDLYTYAKNIGLNEKLFGDCFESRAKSARIREDMALGTQRNIQGTPTFFINGEQVSDWSTLEQQLDARLQPAVPTRTSDTSPKPVPF